MIDIAIISGVVVSMITEITKLFPQVESSQTVQRLVCLGLTFAVTFGYILTEPDVAGGDMLQFVSIALGTSFLTYQTVLKLIP